MSFQHWNRMFTLLFILAFVAGMVQPATTLAAPPLAEPAAPVTQADALAKIEPLVLKEIAAEGQTEFFVWMTEKADLTPAHSLRTKLEKGQFVYETLRATADRTQRALRAELDAQGIKYRPFYIANKIFIHAGDEALALNLAARPDVAKITPNRQFQLEEPMIGPQTPAEVTAIEPNITFIQAPLVWDMGFRGEGMVLAGNDTGLVWNHPAIINQYRGWDGVTADHNYNWWDATGTYPMVPNDGHGHGTHITGTMVGDDGGANQIGVAPGAKTIHCKNMTDGGSGNDFTFSTCFEWDLAPWDLSGNNPRPDLAPHAINNSWGYWGGGAPQFIDEIEALQAAGIVVEVSAGNEGPSCGTLRSPGDYAQVLTTGSVNHAGGVLPGTLTGFSSRGPSSLFPGEYFPDIMAPGENIRSSVGSSGYASWSGTSMAGPHATALIALIWQAAPVFEGNVADTYDIIHSTAVPLSGVSGSNCGGDYETGPNNDWGFGTIDALAAVLQALDMSTAGTLQGTVTDSVTSGPIAGAHVLMESIDYTMHAYTDADGFYWRVIPEGVYTVTVSAYGYFSQVFTDVVITEDETTILDVALDPAPAYTVEGYVTDALTGWPLYASIDIGGYPGPAVWTAPDTGYYSVELVADMTYTFNVSTWVAGYLPQSRDVTVTGDMTEDFALEADLLACTAPGYSFEYLYYENFNADDGGFVTDGPAPAPWQWGTPITWPSSCVDGVNCWGTNLNGNYNNNANQSIISPVIDLSGVSPGEDLSVRWHQAWHIESATWDRAYAEVSIGGGPWEIMWQHTGPTVQVPWTEMSYDISAAAGSNVQFRFRFTSDSSVNYNGYYIDALGIVAGEDCQPQAGGLVGGNVYDANTAEPLVGALVETEDAITAVAQATPGDPNLDDGFYLLFSPAGDRLFTASYPGYSDDVATVNVVQDAFTWQHFYPTAGYLDFDPPALEFTVEYGQTATLPMTVTNLGADAASFSLTAGLLTEHFEGSFPPADWTVINNGGNCVWQRNDTWPRPNYAGGDGFSAAADSDACGIGTTMNTELWSPAFDLSGATTATLDFVASYRHLSTSSFRVDVSADGGATWTNELTWTASVDPTGPGYPVSIDLADYLGSSDVIVRFHYQAPGWHWWAQVDQVQVYADQTALLSFTPSGATLDAGEFVDIDVTVDTNALPEPGTYSAAILVEHDTPYDVANIPVTIHATLPPGMGLLEGTVTGLGFCDANPAPLAGAEVLVESGEQSWTRYTDADGYYYLYLDETYSPVTITVTAAEHEGGLAEDVEIVGQQTTTVDFDLRWLKACVSAEPQSFEVTVLLGQTDSQMLTLTNQGAVDSGFEIREREGGYNPLLALAGFTPEAYSAAAAIGPLSVRSPEGRAALGEALDNPLAWTPGTPLPAGDGVVRYAHAQCAEDFDNFYVISGVNQAFSVTNKVWRYTASTGTWTQLANIPVGQEGPSAVCYDGFIYVAGGGGTNQFYIYDISANSWSPAPALPRNVWGAAMAVRDGQIFMVGGDNDFSFGGTSNQVNIYDIAAGAWIGTGASMPTAAVTAGFAQVGQYLYVVGGWGDASPGSNVNQTQRYDLDGDAWETGPLFTSARADHALAVTEQYLYAMGGDANGGGPFDATNVVEVLEHTAWPGGAWTASTSLPQSLTAMKGGFCTETVTEGEVWLTGGFTGGAIVNTNQYEAAQACFSEVPVDVPWLSAEPVSGTVEAGGMVEITVTFDTTVLTETGTYTAGLLILNDNPVGGRLEIPVTMHVLPVEYGVTVDPAEAALSGAPGETVTYQATITNTGNVPDTFTLALHGHTWETEASHATLTLAAGASAVIQVHVTIPAEAEDGDHDTVTATVTSQGDDSKSAAMTMTTTAEIPPPEVFRQFLPIINKNLGG